MRYNVKTIPPFDRQLKRLKKKYPSLNREYTELLELLEKDPDYGISIGKNCFKIRVSIASKGKGKSGGARVITHFMVTEDSVFLLSIYDKAEQEDMMDSKLEELLKQVFE